MDVNIDETFMINVINLIYLDVILMIGDALLQIVNKIKSGMSFFQKYEQFCKYEHSVLMF